jgi:hypothetical protein
VSMVLVLIGLKAIESCAMPATGTIFRRMEDVLLLLLLLSKWRRPRSLAATIVGAAAPAALVRSPPPVDELLPALARRCFATGAV